MKKNREVSIGVCGAIVGVLLGAGSVSYSQQVSGSLLGDLLTNSLSYGYRNIEFQNTYQANAGRHHAASGPLTEPEKAHCRTKIRIAEDLRNIIVPLVPARPIDDMVRRSMHSAFTEYLSGCTEVYAEVMQTLVPATQPVAAPVPTEPEPVQHTDISHCTGLSGPRYTNCIGAARDNIEYKATDN